jgi:hypothetical protein
MAKDPKQSAFCAAAESFTTGSKVAYSFENTPDRARRAGKASARSNKLKARLKKLEAEGKL